MTIPYKTLHKWCELNNATYLWYAPDNTFGYEKDGIKHTGNVIKAINEVVEKENRNE